MPLPADKKERDAFFDFAARGDAAAIEYLDAIAALVYLADDSVDEDLPFATRQDYMLRILWLTLVRLPSNPFHARFGGSMAPLVMEILVFWQKSDEWKQTGDLKRKLFGFVRRENIDGLVVAVAGIVGGADHAKAVAERIMELCHSHGETLEDWMNEGRP